MGTRKFTEVESVAAAPPNDQGTVQAGVESLVEDISIDGMCGVY